MSAELFEIGSCGSTHLSNYPPKLKTSRRVFGEDHIITAKNLDELATTYRRLDRLDEAAELWDQVVRIRRKIQGHSHPMLFVAIHRLADLAPFYEQRQATESAQSIRDRANRHCLDILKSQREHYGDKHENTLTSMQLAANVLAEQRQHDEALKLQQEIVDTCKQLHE